ncbi:hypothetical protein EXIGLDRAFT_697947 [Exidia glandulosa HHB12029]|uniref:Uncharacterized protein n=1 Tax=Exidia glandulosa HHB12029 TaxID=1314781 RepID=A0A165EI91_EXIGL|nr:hypothetical protein EXIGLDRAFT_697947 [Exidia glandulosa HHB12029]
MGGNAFAELAPGASFPRMSPEVYNALKATMLARLALLFAHVAVPREAPEKDDYGDLDLIVAEPLGAREVPLELLKDTLGAVLAIGGSTSNFAVPMPDGPPDTYVQVDVIKCGTVDKFERVMFFHAYGDLGMILGLIARSYGLSLGHNGLKIVVGSAEDGEPHSFSLSADFQHIMRFFALDLTLWQAGFATQRAIFDWVRTSRLFHPARHRESTRRMHRRELSRTMYLNFLQYARELEESGAYDGVEQLVPADVVAQAKREFGKEDEYNAIVQTNRRRAKMKTVFNGHLVMAWTGAQGLAVRRIMGAVRAVVSEDEMMQMTVEEVEAVVRRVYAELSADEVVSS